MRFQEYLLIAGLFGSQAALGQTTAELFDVRVVHEVRMTMNPAAWQKLKDNIFQLGDEANLLRFDIPQHVAGAGHLGSPQKSGQGRLSRAQGPPYPKDLSAFEPEIQIFE